MSRAAARCYFNLNSQLQLKKTPPVTRRGFLCPTDSLASLATSWLMSDERMSDEGAAQRPTKNEEPRTKNQEPGTKNQEPRTKKLTPRTKNSRSAAISTFTIQNSPFRRRRQAPYFKIHHS